MRPNAESSGGVSPYLVAISSIIAHFAVTWTFHRVYESVAIGLPIQRARANIVLRKALLS